MAELLKEPSQKESALDDPRINQFLEWNEIEEEDFEMIEEFSRFPREFFNEMINANRDKS